MERLKVPPRWSSRSLRSLRTNPSCGLANEGALFRRRGDFLVKLYQQLGFPQDTGCKCYKCDERKRSLAAEFQDGGKHFPLGLFDVARKVDLGPGEARYVLVAEAARQDHFP